MKICYLDCFAGLSGDMFLGAMLDAGLDPTVLHDATAAMNLGASLQIETVDRSGISSIKVHVMEGLSLAEATPPPQLNQPDKQQALKHASETQHQHGSGLLHTHGVVHDAVTSEAPTHDQPLPGNEHVHGRSLQVIRELIQNSGLSQPVIHLATRTFELLGNSEAKIHNVPVEEIHFHEVGAVDAIVDIVATCAGICALAADTWMASPVNVGSGMVDCAHGRFPVPAPAAADLLRGMPTYSASLKMELVTPTGAALLRMLVEEKGLTFGPQPLMITDRIGYGAGSRNPPQHPNVLRLTIGTSTQDSEPAASQTHSHKHDSQTVTVLETALDDLSPQIVSHVAESALQQGALDVMLTPVIMKKGRPGTLLTVLCNPSDRVKFEDLLLRETSTLGVRVREDRRSCLDRIFATVDTPYGPIKIKIGIRAGEVFNANPEFEDCRAAASAHNVPVKQVQQAAIAAYVDFSKDHDFKGSEVNE